MAGRFTPARGLNELVARMVAPAVERIGKDVAKTAAEYAPEVKTWRTQSDILVRPWHRSADRQAVPGNLRFLLEHSPRTYRQYHPPGHELLRFPRDPEAYYLQTRDCRCYLTWGNALAESIGRERVVVAGSRVSVDVATTFPRAVESEFGTDQDPPARFMGQAVRDVAVALR